MRYLLVILVAVAALVGAAPASAHGLLIFHHGPHASLVQIERSQKANLKHARFLCHYGRNATRRWGCTAVRWLTRELNETKAALHPAVTSHWAGWSCITNGAYPGAAHEGNGYNGSYTGPLGMTTPWMGHRPTGVDWVHTPVSVVYADAEEEAAKHHWNYTWMQGQWPETFPPCARHFY